MKYITIKVATDRDTEIDIEIISSDRPYSSGWRHGQRFRQ